MLWLYWNNCNENWGNMPSIHKLDEVDVGLYQFEIKEERERRAVIDRRQFSYSLYIPERRSGQERRKEIDLRESNSSK
jgi:hypothetical protein